MQITTILAIITAMGGLEAVKWMARYVSFHNVELRKEQEEKIDWIHKCHEVELVQKEWEVKKCEIRGCAKRLPPSDY